MSITISVNSGPYSGTYSSSALGITQDGFRIRHQWDVEDIQGDAYGGAIIDKIYRLGRVFVDATSIESESAGVVAALKPFGESALGIATDTGDQGSDTAAALVLTAIQSSSPVSTTPATITAPSAIVGSSDINYNSRARRVPLNFELLLSTISASTGWYSVA